STRTPAEWTGAQGAPATPARLERAGGPSRAVVEAVVELIRSAAVGDRTSAERTWLMKRLAGRTAVITGGASGIGRVVAKRLAAEGSAVRIIDVAPAEATVVRIRDEGGDADHRLADVTSPSEVADALAAPGWTPDFLVNVAGVFSWEDVLDPSRDDWERTIGVD